MTFEKTMIPPAKSAVSHFSMGVGGNSMNGREPDHLLFLFIPQINQKKRLRMYTTNLALERAPTTLHFAKEKKTTMLLRACFKKEQVMGKTRHDDDR